MDLNFNIDENEQSHISFNQNQLVNGYLIQKILYNGSKSSVYQVEKHDQIFSMQIFHEALSYSNKDEIKEMKLEINAVKNINCENVQKLYEYFVFQDHQTLILEYCPETLYDLMQKQKDKVFSEEDTKNILRQIVFGLLAVHQINYIHRNLKLESILVKDEIIKVGGFFKCGKISFNLEYQFIGNQGYMSPEQYFNIPYDYKVDIWSLGVIIWRMLFNKFPFGIIKDEMKFKSCVIQVCNPKFSFENTFKLSNYKNIQKISDEMKDLISRIFVITPEQRITFKELWESHVLSLQLTVELPQLQQYQLQKLNRFQSMQLDNQNVKNQNQNLQKEQKDVLVSQILKTYQIEGEDGIEGIAKECFVLMSMSLLQMYASKETHQKNKSQNLEKLFQEYQIIYKFEVERYLLIIESYEQMKNNTQFILAIKYIEVLIFKFFTIRMILFYIKWLIKDNENKINRFNLDNFDQFQNQPFYIELFKNIQNENDKYYKEYENVKQELQHYETLHYDFDQFIREDRYSPNFMTEYIELTDDVKLPFRAIQFNIYGKLYQLGQQFLKFEAPLNKQINDFAEKKQYSRTQGHIRLRMAFRCIFITIVNRIVNKKKKKIIFNEQVYSIAEIFQFIHQMKSNSIETNIEQLFQKYYTKLNYQKVNYYEVEKYK